MNNCPNCGAPIHSWKCGYCETIFYDLATDYTIGGDEIGTYRPDNTSATVAILNNQITGREFLETIKPYLPKDTINKIYGK